MNKKDYYKILQVSPLASSRAIKKSYQKLAQRYHPDKNKSNPQATEIFNDINEAYQILSDSFKRKDFDRQIKKQKENFKHKDSFSPLYDSFHVHPPETFENPPFSTWQPPPMSHPPSSSPDFWGIFNRFTTRVKTFFNSTQKSLHTEHIICGKLDISLEEAAFGCQKSIVVKMTEKAKKIQKKILITVPPGSEHLQKIKVNKKSYPFLHNIYVQICYQPHPFFKKFGQDILMDLPVAFTTAVLGGKAEVPTIRGAVSFQLPVACHNGHTIRLKKQGFPPTAKADAGDMLVTVCIDIPTDLSEEEKNWIKKIHDRRPLCQSVSEFNIQYKHFLKDRRINE